MKMQMQGNRLKEMLNLLISDKCDMFEMQLFLHSWCTFGETQKYTMISLNYETQMCLLKQDLFLQTRKY